ncbi:hypothetical protein [Archaeoglobus neptunius]|uniref:hypothetical protein n=1 Tax=Archaeoglobus neptunius TaxID=2798580 RepID=UPI001928EAA8|nr:hypothetical protein [Archaeoglobus neptunius]
MNRIEYIKEKIEKLDFSKSLVKPFMVNKYRKEDDGRILTFSPLTGKICVLNPTLALIYETIIQRAPVDFHEILAVLSDVYDEVSINILERDLKGALTWLLLNGFVELEGGEGIVNIQTLLEDGA